MKKHNQHHFLDEVSNKQCDMEGFPFAPQDVIEAIGWKITSNKAKEQQSSITDKDVEIDERKPHEKLSKKVCSLTSKNCSDDSNDETCVKVKRAKVTERNDEASFDGVVINKDASPFVDVGETMSDVTNGNDIDKTNFKKELVPGIFLEELKSNESPFDLNSVLYFNNDCTSRIAILGSAHMSVLRGSVEMLGYTFEATNESDKSTKIVSSSGEWISAHVLQASSFCNVSLEGKESMADANNFDNVVHMRSVASNEAPIITSKSGNDDSKRKTFQLVPENIPKFSVSISQSWVDAGNRVCDEYVKYVSPPCFQENVTGERPQIPPRILVCGAKGVGKVCLSMKYKIKENITVYLISMIFL